MESHLPLVQAEKFARRLAVGLDTLSTTLRKSLVHQRKRNMRLLTLLSGPHVHKKSRDQYNITRYSATFIVFIRNKDDFKTFLEYKNKLHNHMLSTLCFELTIVYEIHRIVRLLP